MYVEIVGAYALVGRTQVSGLALITPASRCATRLAAVLLGRLVPLRLQVRIIGLERLALVQIQLRVQPLQFNLKKKIFQIKI
jgi:hypothetical protein